MIKLTEIQKSKLPKYVILSYEGDDDLLEKFHVKKFTLIEAVNSTLGMIDSMDDEIELKFYAVMFNETPIGYIITSGTFLYSFAISIKYRTRMILTEWWDAVIQKMGERISVGLLSNNTRAIDYMKKRGMSIFWSSPEDKLIKEVFLSN